MHEHICRDGSDERWLSLEKRAPQTHIPLSKLTHTRRHGMTDQNDLQDLLLGYLKSQQPQGSRTELLNMTRISNGWETDVHYFTVRSQRDGKLRREDLILRLYPGDGASEKAAREFHAMAKLYHIGYPVPKVHYLGTDRSAFGKPFVIMDKINGQSLGQVLEASTQTERENLYALFVRLLVELHKQDISPFLADPNIIPDSEACGTDSPYGYLDRLLAGFRQALASLDADDRASALFHEIMDWLERGKLAFPCKRLSPVHLDYHPYNILVDNGGQLFVIDWTNFGATDYRVDLAWTVLLANTYGRLEMRDTILRMYKEFAGFAVENIEYFEAIAATRRLGSIVLSLRKGAEKLGMRSETTEVLKKQTEHIRAVCRVLSARTGIPLSGFDGPLKL